MESTGLTRKLAGGFLLPIIVTSYVSCASSYKKRPIEEYYPREVYGCIDYRIESPLLNFSNTKTNSIYFFARDKRYELVPNLEDPSKIEKIKIFHDDRTKAIFSRKQAKENPKIQKLFDAWEKKVQDLANKGKSFLDE